jgi:uncharacterized membrane protein
MRINMKKRLPILIFVLVEIVVAVFILSTAGDLPENIASHFNGAGMPNGFMSKAGYTQFMLLFAVGIPALVVCFISFVLRVASGTINIPNKEYWLSPENKSSTMQFFQGHIACLGVLIALFMAYIHWLLLKANSVQPPQLPNRIFFVGLGIFLAGMLLWGVWLILRFMRVPKA